jgi:Na+/proline symporter
MAAVMASDSQILALSTMFTEDVVAFYLGAARARDALLVHTGRLFVAGVTAVAYAIALIVPQSIFDIATQYAFAGIRRCRRCSWRRCSGKAARGGARSPPAVWTAAAVLAVACSVGRSCPAAGRGRGGC